MARAEFADVTTYIAARGYDVCVYVAFLREKQRGLARWCCSAVATLEGELSRRIIPRRYDSGLLRPGREGG